MRTHTIAKSLGWFSIGLGAAELLAPGLLGRFLGTRRHGVLRGFGLREIAAGIGILTADRVAPWIWGRVAGDGLDLAALVLALARGEKRRNAAIATAAVAGVTALDIVVGKRLSTTRQLDADLF